MKLTDKLVLTCLLAVTVAMTPCTVSAQTGINSPYSRYGLGILSDQSVGMSRAMGGVGVGLRKSNTVNTLNPASYSAVDTLTFIADMGFSIQNGNYQESNVKVNARNANVDYMAMQYRILPKVGMTVGFLPFSNVGYSFSNTNVIYRDNQDGDTKTTGSYSGSGGTRQFMAGLGYRPTKWLSVGANASYLFGDLEYSSNVTFTQSTVSSSYVKYNAEISALKLDFGLQGTIKRKKSTFVLGATYTPATDFSGDVTKTALTTETEAEPQSLGPGAFSIPDMFALGLSYSDENLTLAADASYQTWSKARFLGQKEGADRLRLSAGFSYCPDNNSKSFLKHNTYRGGLYMQQPYYTVGGRKGPMEYGIGAGFTMPVTIAYNSMSYLHFTAQYVRVQPGQSGMVTENYLRFTVGVSFLERWFAKWMVE